MGMSMVITRSIKSVEQCIAAIGGSFRVSQLFHFSELAYYLIRVLPLICHCIWCMREITSLGDSFWITWDILRAE